MAETKKKAPGKSRRKSSYRPLKLPKSATGPTVGEILDGDTAASEQGAGNPDTDARDANTDNQPPPFEYWSMRADDLFGEAENWLDGDPIANEQQAEAVTALKAMLQAGEKEAEAARSAEKKPFLDAGREVDAKWKPVIDRLAKARTVAQRALTPWLEAVEAENRRKAEVARIAAEQERRRLEEAQKLAALSSDLASEDQVEAAEAAAKEAARVAREAEKETAVVRTGAGKATLRTEWLVNVKDYRELLNYYLRHRPDVADELRKWLFAQAKKDVRGGARSLPGCSIWDEKRAI